jgi:hypothetical protein
MGQVFETSDHNDNAVFARNDATTAAPNDGGVHATGVFGLTVSPGAAGVFGANNSTKGVGVQGNGPGPNVKGPDSIGLGAFSDAGWAVFGNSNTGSGVLARSGAGHGLDTFSDKDIALFAQGGTFSGVFNGALVVNKSPQLNPDPNNPAKPIDGCIVVNDGNLFLNNGGITCPKGTTTCFDLSLSNADCAEEFELTHPHLSEPGTVMSLDGEGALRPSQSAYDKRVAGVISGAGEYQPGIVLDRKPGRGLRAPVALMGKVYCKVDADYASIQVGDLLTTSSTQGHAMKAADPFLAFGAVIGKALRPLLAGRGLIPVLVALQ